MGNLLFAISTPKSFLRQIFFLETLTADCGPNIESRSNASGDVSQQFDLDQTVLVPMRCFSMSIILDGPYCTVAWSLSVPFCHHFWPSCLNVQAIVQ